MVLFVDNCYGEFVEPREPCHVGADLVAGSLIKVRVRVRGRVRVRVFAHQGQG